MIDDPTNPIPRRSELYAGLAASEPPLVGGQRLAHQVRVSGEGEVWSADKLEVLDGELGESPSWLPQRDIWTGQFGRRPAIAFASDTSIQVRDLKDGELLAVRMTGQGHRHDGHRVPGSVSLCGSLVAFSVDGRVEVRDWEDFAAVQILTGDDLPWDEDDDLILVRLLDAGGIIWLAASDRLDLWAKPIRFPMRLRTSATPVPRAWRSLGVAPDGLLVAGVDAQGAVWGVGDRRYEQFLATAEDRQPEGDCATFPISKRPRTALSIGRLLTVHRGPAGW